MKLPAILQVRNGSKRLPQKAMMLILGKPVISYAIERIRAVSAIETVVVATTTASEDDAIEQYCNGMRITCYRGNSDDVLERIIQCAKTYAMEHFVKFWGDSPLIDPQLCSYIISKYQMSYAGYDYVSNNHPSTYPEGMQLEIIRTQALIQASTADDLQPEDREHVTSYIWRHPEFFKTAKVETKGNRHDRYRMVIDYPEDVEQITRIIEALYAENKLFSMQDIMRFLDEHPDVQAINANRYESEEEYDKRVFRS